VELPAGFRVVSEPTAFERRVAELVDQIPPGRVASYGRLAGWLGMPAASRAVGGALAKGLGTAAHRVVDASGRLAPGWEREQRELLRSEGVRVQGRHVAPPVPWWDGPGL
jgi:methylated-DNA-protein-cysteine methyltransferase related protein